MGFYNRSHCPDPTAYLAERNIRRTERREAREREADMETNPDIKTLTFTVPGKPQGKGRARTVRHGKYTQTFTPEKTVLYENWIKTCYQKAAGGYQFPEGSSIKLKITAVFSVPKSYSNIRRISCLAGSVHPKSKPDADNIAKCVADALNGIAYHDDACVWSLEVSKKYGESASEGLLVHITNAEEYDG